MLKLSKPKATAAAAAAGTAGALAAACAACCATMPLATPLLAYAGISGLGAWATGWYLPVAVAATAVVVGTLILRRRRLAGQAGCGGLPTKL
jgi:hypothetical protein